MKKEDKLNEVRQRTREERPEFPTWMDQISGIWADMFHSVKEEIPEEEFTNGMMVTRIMELQKFMTILESGMYSGFYYSLIRDLRYHLEAFVRAFYIDNRYSDSDFKVRNAALKELDVRNPTGLRLLDKHFPKQVDHRNEMRELYSELCEYVHPSYSEWEEAQKDPAHRTLAMFNDNSFDKTKIFTERTFTAVSYLVLEHYFPKKASNVDSLEELRGKLLGDDKVFPVQITST